MNLNSKEKRIRIKIDHSPQGPRAVEIKNLGKIELRGLTIGDFREMEKNAGLDAQKYTHLVLSKVINKPTFTLEQLSHLPVEVIQEICLSWLEWTDPKHHYYPKVNYTDPSIFYENFKLSIQSPLYELTKELRAVILPIDAVVKEFLDYTKSLGLPAHLLKSDFLKSLQDTINSIPNYKLLESLRKGIELNTKFTGIFDELSKVNYSIPTQNILSFEKMKDLRSPAEETLNEITTLRKKLEDSFEINKKILTCLLETFEKQEKSSQSSLQFQGTQKIQGYWLIFLTLFLVLLTFLFLVKK